MLTDEEIARRLRLIVAVQTGAQHIRNDIIEVGSHHVVVRSERTGNNRTIPYDYLRQAATVVENGVIVRVLAQILGMYEGDYEGLPESE